MYCVWLLSYCVQVLFFLFFFFCFFVSFFFQAEDGIRDRDVTGVQTCALPIFAITIVLGFQIKLLEPARTGQDTCHSIVAFVTGVLIEILVDPRERVLAREWLSKHGRIFHGEAIDHLVIGVPAKGFDDGEVLGRHAVQSLPVIEV